MASTPAEPRYDLTSDFAYIRISLSELRRMRSNRVDRTKRLAARGMLFGMVRTLERHIVDAAERLKPLIDPASPVKWSAETLARLAPLRFITRLYTDPGFDDAELTEEDATVDRLLPWLEETQAAVEAYDKLTANDTVDRESLDDTDARILDAITAIMREGSPALTVKAVQERSGVSAGRISGSAPWQQLVMEPRRRTAERRGKRPIQLRHLDGVIRPGQSIPDEVAERLDREDEELWDSARSQATTEQRQRMDAMTTAERNAAIEALRRRQRAEMRDRFARLE